MTIEVIIDSSKCTGCGKCYDVCPKGGKIFKKKKNGKYYAYDTSFCFKCYACTGRCPTNAIIVRDKEEGESNNENKTPNLPLHTNCNNCNNCTIK